MRWRTCSSVSAELQATSRCTETSCETFMPTPAAPCVAIARTTSRSVNMPTAVLPSVRTTSFTTSALILLVRMSCAATATVSFIRMVTTRAVVFLRRMSPTFIATSLGLSGCTAFAGLCWYTLYQMSNTFARFPKDYGAASLTHTADRSPQKRAYRGAPFSARISGQLHSAGWPTVRSSFCDELIDSLIGRTTNSASPTTTRFMIDATTNTACQLPVCAFRTLASGTTKADVPFAVYIRAVLVVANFGPNISVVVEGNRLKISPHVKKTIAALITNAHGVEPAAPSSQ